MPNDSSSYRQGNESANGLPRVPYQRAGQQFEEKIGISPIGTHIVTVPVKFGSPPTSRDAVWQAVGWLPGWNSLEPKVGTTDPTLFELRLDVTAASDAEAVK